MSSKESEILRNIAKNIDVIPEEKREYLLGIGEGLRLAKSKETEAKSEKEEK